MRFFRFVLYLKIMIEVEVSVILKLHATLKYTHSAQMYCVNPFISGYFTIGLIGSDPIRISARFIFSRIPSYSLADG